MNGSGPRADLRAAIVSLVGPGDENPVRSKVLEALSNAFEAYLRARQTGEVSTLDLSNDLPAPDLVVKYSLEFASMDIRHSLTGNWHDRTFRNAARQRSGLEALASATAVDADVSGADDVLRAMGSEGYLSPDEIPDVPTSHWWWWLPGDPPAH